MSRYEAMRAAEAAYAVRVCGMSPPMPRYTGPFDLMAVVNAAPIPSTPDMQMHRACWAEFRRMFEQSWNERAER